MVVGKEINVEMLIQSVPKPLADTRRLFPNRRRLEREPVARVRRQESHRVALPQSDGEKTDLAGDESRLLQQERCGSRRVGRGGERCKH